MINTKKILQKGLGIKKSKRRLKQYTTHDIFDYFEIENAPIIERTTHGSLNFPQTGTLKAYDKSLKLVGKFKDLFKYGNHIQIINRHEDVVRDIERENGNVKIDPKGGVEIIYINVNDDIYYEAWMMDNGSFLFNAPKSLIGYNGKLLKLMTEGDRIEVV